MLPRRLSPPVLIVLSAVLLLSNVVAGAAQPAASQPTLSTVVQRIGAYVAGYGQQASLILATEKDAQRVDGHPAVTYIRRNLTAQVVLVPGGDTGRLTGYRDVVQVDKASLTKDPNRLAAALAAGTGDRSAAQKIAADSSQYGVSPIGGSFNLPTTALLLFTPQNLSRFTFTRDGTKTVDGVEAWVLGFRETQRPTLVTTREGRDVPAEGSIWVLPSDGTVVRTTLTLRGFSDDKQFQKKNKILSTNDVTTKEVLQGSAATQNQAQTQAGPLPKDAGLPVFVETKTEKSQGLEPNQLLNQADDPRWLESLGRIEVTYARDAASGLWVPAHKSELWEGPLRLRTRPPFQGRATSVADYSDYRITNK